MRRGPGLLLSAYLLVWVPVSVAMELVSTLPSLRMRGIAAVIELMSHAVVAAFAVAADRMLAAQSPAAFTAASIAIVAAGAAAIQSLYWTVLPRNIAPGTRRPLAILWIVITIVCLVLIQRARGRR